MKRKDRSDRNLNTLRRNVVVGCSLLLLWIIFKNRVPVAPKEVTLPSRLLLEHVKDRIEYIYNGKTWTVEKITSLNQIQVKSDSDLGISIVWNPPSDSEYPIVKDKRNSALFVQGFSLDIVEEYTEKKRFYSDPSNTLLSRRNERIYSDHIFKIPLNITTGIYKLYMNVDNKRFKLSEFPIFYKRNYRIVSALICGRVN